jgi:hypothetical protein
LKVKAKYYISNWAKFGSEKSAQMVRSILTYAALLWWKKASQISVNRKTAHMQRLVCVSITGSMHSTRTAALEVILMMLPPLGIYIEGEARQRILLEQDLNIRKFLKRCLMSGHLFWPQETKSFLLLLLEGGF